MPAVHAPPQGVTVRGVYYRAGQFIPGDVVASLSDDEAKEAGLMKGHLVGPHPKFNFEHPIERSSTETFGHFSPADWNRHYEQVLQTVPQPTNENPRAPYDEIKTWPEYENHVKWGSSDPYTEAVKSRTWKLYQQTMYPHSEAQDRFAAVNKPARPDTPGLIGRYDTEGKKLPSKQSERNGSREYESTYGKLSSDIQIDHGVAGWGKLHDKVKEAYNRPLTDEEQKELDAEVKRVDGLLKSGSTTHQEFPGYRAAEQRVRLRAADKAARAELGEVEDPERSANLKELVEEHGEDNHGWNHIADLYDAHRDDEGGTNEQAKQKTEAELQRRRELFDQADKEFTAAHGEDYDSGHLHELYGQNLENDVEHPMEKAIEAHRKKLADPGGAFLENYHQHDDLEDRVSEFVDAMDNGASADKWDEDTKQLVAEDLANQSDPVTNLMAQYDSRFADAGPGERDIYHRAFAALPTGKAKAFNGRSAYHVVNLDDAADTDDEEALKHIARAQGIVWQSPDGRQMMIPPPDDSPDFYSQASSDLTDDEPDGSGQRGWQAVFDHLPNPTVSEQDVPQSARNFGRVSGGENADIEEDWNPNSVDVHKPLSKDWYLLRRGDGNPDLTDDDNPKPRYELVHRKNAGMRIGLPPQFWEGMESRTAEEQDTDDEAVEKAKARKERGKGTKAGARAQKKVLTAKERLEAFKKSFGQLADRHNQLSRREESAEAHRDKADAALEEFNHTAQWYTDAGEHPYHGAMTDLEQSLHDLKDHAGYFPSNEEFNLGDVNELIRDAQEYSQGEDRNYLAGQYKEKAKEALAEHKDLASRLKATGKEFDDHFAKLRDRWTDVLDKAKAVIQKGRGYEGGRPTIDPGSYDADTEISADEIKDSVKMALATAKLAKRQLRKIDRSRTAPKVTK